MSIVVLFRLTYVRLLASTQHCWCEGQSQRRGYLPLRIVKLDGDVVHCQTQAHFRFQAWLGHVDQETFPPGIARVSSRSLSRQSKFSQCCACSSKMLHVP